MSSASVTSRPASSSSTSPGSTALPSMSTLTVEPGSASAMSSATSPQSGPVGRGGTPVTVTRQIAVMPPSAVVTVMVAVPGATAVTLPLPSTVATDKLSLLHVTFLLVASLGVMVALRITVPPTVRLALVLFSVTPVTETVAVVTVRVAAWLVTSVLFPSVTTQRY